MRLSSWKYSESSSSSGDVLRYLVQTLKTYKMGVALCYLTHGITLLAYLDPDGYHSHGHNRQQNYTITTVIAINIQIFISDI